MIKDISIKDELKDIFETYLKMQDELYKKVMTEKDPKLKLRYNNQFFKVIRQKHQLLKWMIRNHGRITS